MRRIFFRIVFLCILGILQTNWMIPQRKSDIPQINSFILQITSFIPQTTRLFPQIKQKTGSKDLPSEPILSF